MSIPWGFVALSFVLCLAVTAPGLKRVYYFVSLCYAGAIAAQALLIWLVHYDTASGFTLLMLVLLILYGARLGGFLLRRASYPPYAQVLASVEQRTSGMTDRQKLMIWGGVSVLYTLLALPAWLAATAQARDASMLSVPLGVLVMLAGLVIETVADWQKSSFKAAQPTQFCDIGLYRVVRFPNYFGEMVFWLGVWIAGISVYGSVAAWLLTTLALLYMVVLMVGAARSLELKQDERYGEQPRYQEFVRNVPVLVPKLPVYSLRNINIPIR